MFGCAHLELVLALSPAGGVRGGAQLPVTSQGPRAEMGWVAARGGRPASPLPAARARPGPPGRHSQPQQHMVNLARLRATEWRR